MSEITYKYITWKSEEFKQVIDLRFSILFKPYDMIKKYEYDELDKKSMHLVALNEEKVVAYSRMTNFNGEGKITNVVVSSDYINRGIGFEMMKRHISKAKEFNIYMLYLNARLNTVDFYKKVGFSCEGMITISEKSGLALQNMCIKFNRN